MIDMEALEVGDVVQAAVAFHNDGGFRPAEDALPAPEDSRGVTIRKGHLEGKPGRIRFLVGFEDADKTLALGAWPEGLRAEVELH